jgi:hypothetical protein
MFYSPKGGETGTWLNVIGRGAIVVDDIRFSEGGRTIFEEDFEDILPGPGVRTFGGTMKDGRVKGKALRTSRAS